MRSSFSRLIGASPGPIRWERALALWAALLISGQLGMLIVTVSTNNAFSGIEFAFGLPARQVGLGVLLTLSETICAVLFFRLARNPWLAAAAGAVVYSGLAVLARLLVTGQPYRHPVQLALSCLYFFLYVGAIAAVLSWTRIAWWTTALGAVAGEVLSGLAITIGWNVVHPGAPASPPLSSIVTETVSGLPMALLMACIFATLIYAGFENLGQRRRLSRPFYTSAVIWGLILASTCLLTLLAMGRPQGTAGWILTGVIAAATLLHAVASLMLWYKMWAAIQDGHVRIGPGLAVGLLFVPIFNLFWGFVVFGGFAREYNRYLERHSIRAARLSPALFACFMIPIWIDALGSRMLLAGEGRYWPVAWGCFALALGFAWLGITHRICRAVNDLDESASVRPAAAGAVATA